MDKSASVRAAQSEVSSSPAPSALKRVAIHDPGSGMEREADREERRNVQPYPVDEQGKRQRILHRVITCRLQ
jgi:hypothetical protein